MVQRFKVMEGETMESAMIKWTRDGKVVEESVRYEEHPLFSRCVLVHFADGSNVKMEKPTFFKRHVILEF